MNAVEIEQAVTELSEQPFDRVKFPFAFLAAFGRERSSRSPRGTDAGTPSAPPSGQKHYHLWASGAVLAQHLPDSPSNDRIRSR